MHLRTALAALLALPLCAQTAGRRTPLSEPAISPDHTEIAFVSGGDIWTVGAAGGTARLLVSHPATESRPVYSPDGTRLAFTSTRTGNGDVYVLHLPTGDLKRLTFSEAPERVDNWSADGKYIYFSTTGSDIAGMPDIQRVRVDGGTPMVYSGDRYTAEYFAAPHPSDPATVALTAKGVVYAQWWRNGHSHIDESEIWIRHDGPQQPKYERLSRGGAKEAWPMWSADGRSLFYMSDSGGAENIWTRTAAPGATPKQLTQFKDGRVLWPTISRDGKTVVFERDFGIWSLDTATGKAAPVKIALRGTPASPGVQRPQLTSGFSSLALSPDGKKVVFIARGDVFAAGARESGPATRLTATAALEDEVAWAPDNKRVVYTSDRDNAIRLYTYDLGSNTESRLTATPGNDTSPVWSPDGKSIAFVRNGTKLMVIDVASKAEREVAQISTRQAPLNGTHNIAWSPDNKWIAYGDRGLRLFWNVHVVPAAGGTPVPASYLANADGGGIIWSPDGQYLLFQSGQRTEPNKVARVDLIPRTPRFREDQFRDLFKDTTKTPQQQQPAQPAATGKSEPAPPAAADSKQVKVVAEGIRGRLSILPTGIDAQDLAVSPDGKTLLITGSAAGQTNLWTYSLDELSREPAVARQLTSTPGRKSDAQFSPDGKEVWYLESGRITAIPLDTRTARPVSVSAEVDIDFTKDKAEVFAQAWSYLNLHFYDEKFHGLDWNAARTRYAPWIEGSQTPDEMRRVIGLMIGDLNASHTGISGPLSTPAPTGHLGLRFDRAEYDSKGALRVAELIRLGPAEVAGIKLGEYLTAIDGVPVTPNFSLPEALEYKTNRRVTLTIASDASGAGAREVAVSPVSNAQEKALLYRQWVEASREYVHRVSNGRLGYVHMADMSEASLDRLYMDLDTENVGRDGVVVDVRNNNGGFVNVYALDVLARRPFLNMTPRGASTVPARSFLGQRSLERPTILVTNQHSLSDAEDFTEGYRSMKLGKVVGEPTAGWIIYTTGAELLDGSVLRLPSIRITDAQGRNMERNPRPVDLPVLRSVGESYAGQDTQLDAAVRELLKEVGMRSTSARPTSGSGGGAGQ